MRILGHFFIAIDTSKLAPTSCLHERMADFHSILLDTPPTDPTAPVMVPGDREMAAYARSSHDGITVALADLREVERLSKAVRGGLV